MVMTVTTGLQKRAFFVRFQSQVRHMHCSKLQVYLQLLNLARDLSMQTAQC